MQHSECPEIKDSLRHQPVIRIRSLGNICSSEPGYYLAYFMCAAQNSNLALVLTMMLELKSNQIKYLFLLQVYIGPINSALYLHLRILIIACNTCAERILVRLNLV